jgi:hypothetical protein
VCTCCNLRRYVFVVPLCDSNQTNVLAMASNDGSNSCGMSFRCFVLCRFDQAWGPLLEIPSKTNAGINISESNNSRMNPDKGFNTIAGYLNGSYKPFKYQKIKIQNDVNKDIESLLTSEDHKCKQTDVKVQADIGV